MMRTMMLTSVLSAGAMLSVGNGTAKAQGYGYGYAPAYGAYDPYCSVYGYRAPVYRSYPVYGGFYGGFDRHRHHDHRHHHHYRGGRRGYGGYFNSPGIRFDFHR
jgi:hypothetical protein